MLLLILSRIKFLPFFITLLIVSFNFPFSFTLLIAVSNPFDIVSIIPPVSTAFCICEISSNFPVTIPIALLPKSTASSIAPSLKPSLSIVSFIFITSSSTKSGNKYLIPRFSPVFMIPPKVVSKKLFCSFSTSKFLLFNSFCMSISIYFILL